MPAPVTPPPHDTTQDAPARVLKIVAGVHAGATRPLAAQEMLLIGRGDDCDLVLSDPDVAPHHALLTVMGSDVLVRAIGAPVRLDDQTIRPGDPVVVGDLQRVTLGSAAFAVGDEGDACWATLSEPPTLPHASRSRLGRHLPWVAGLAALSLMSVAIFAAVMPDAPRQPPPEARAQRVLRDFGVGDARVDVSPSGTLVVHGTVADARTRTRIDQKLRAQGLDARVELRTGEDIAHDVREVLRSQGLTAHTRWLGKGDVEVVGRFEDEAALKAAATSRAMREVAGVRRVIPRNLVQPEPRTMAMASSAPARSKAPIDRIVAVRQGEDPHVVTADGTRYRIGAALPSGRVIVAIGRQVWLMDGDEVVPVKPQPATPADATAHADAAATPTGLPSGRPMVAPGRTSVRAQ